MSGAAFGMLLLNASEFTMMTKRNFLLSGVSLAAAGALAARFGIDRARSAASKNTFAVTKTDEEWKAILTPEQYGVLREHDTERPGSSPLLNEKRKGTYHCAGCQQAVYSSDTKFESGTGWPSYWAAIDGSVGTQEDNTLFMNRTEVHCGRCGGHLGHIFDDGPQPTGMRHCINGVAMTFSPAAGLT